MAQVSLGTRVARGWSIAMTSWRFILNNKSILFFSACTVVLNFAVLMSFFHYVLKEILTKKNVTILHMFTPRILIAAVFTFLILQALLSNIMHVALSSYTVAIFEKKPASILGSIGRGIKRIFTLLAWTLIDLLMGIIVASLRGNNRGVSGLMQNILGAVISLAWKILTFFVIPIIAIKELGTIEAIKESAHTMRNTWGENLGATFNIGLISFLAYGLLGTVTALFVAAWTNIDFITLFTSKEIIIPPDQVYPVVFWVTIIAVVPTVILSPLFSAARTIFKTAVYQYTQKQPTGPFSNDFIKTSFETTPTSMGA